MTPADALPRPRPCTVPDLLLPVKPVSGVTTEKRGPELRTRSVPNKIGGPLLDPETPVDGVTAGKVRPELKLIGLAAKVGGGQFGGADVAVAARWGIVGKGGVTMPGPERKTERPFSREE